MVGINARRRERGELWQARFFDRALRTGKEYNETAEYTHLTPPAGAWWETRGIGSGPACMSTPE